MFKLQIGCFIIVLFISLIYFSTKRMKTYPHILFSASLITTTINLLFDVITVYTVNHLDTVPEWLNRACHNVFLITLFLEVFIYYLYCMSLVDEKTPTKNKLAVLSTPLILSVICVIALPLEYVETPMTNYSYGPSVVVLYIFIIGVVVIALVKILIHFREINPKKRYVIITAMAIQFICLIIQSIFKNILITSEGLTLINLACFLTVESPDVLLLEQLKEEKERANKASVAKSTFLVQMSHEIRTPINAVLGMNEMILREAKEDNIREYAGNAYNAGNTLLSIINDILDISKIEAGKLEITETEYDLYSLVSDCYLMVHDRAAKKGLKLMAECDETLPLKLKGDMFHIRQIAVNLLTNAIKYTDTGSVRLKISGKESESGFTLKISVKDTGIGLTEESLEKLFTAFQRFDLKRNQTVEGTGLGLAICKRLAELMGGSIEVNSVYGEGSEFICTVLQEVTDKTPIGKIDLAHSAKKVIAENKTAFTALDASILVVDDVEMNLVVFRNLLKEHGLSIDTADSGRMCLEMIQKKKYDIIFMDHMMPEMDGIETFAKMKETAHLNVDTPVVMLTANAIAGEKEKYLSAGFSSYLTKPIQSEKLEKTILKYLPAEKVTYKQEVELPGIIPETVIPNSERFAMLKKAVPDFDLEGAVKNCGGSEDFYIELLKDFAVTKKLCELEEAMEQKDYERYERLIHTVKGSMRTFGFSELGNIAELLQKAAEERDEKYIAENHGKAAEILSKIAECVEKM